MFYHLIMHVQRLAKLIRRICMGLFSVFSRSSSKGHYRSSNHGSGYYKRGHKSSFGFFDSIIRKLFSGKRYSHSSSDYRHSSHYNKEHYHSHHKKHYSSWS